MTFSRILIASFLMLGCCLSQEFPDAPTVQPKTWEAKHGKPANFFTFRSNWQDPALRSNKQTFKSPVFIIGQSMLVGSMIVACKRKNSREEFHSEAGAVGGVVALDYLFERFFSGAYALGPAIYGTVHYSIAAAR